MTYIFDYEDGESEVVKGKQLSELYVDMTMYGNGRHFYSEGKSESQIPVTLSGATYRQTPAHPLGLQNIAIKIS